MKILVNQSDLIIDNGINIYRESFNGENNLIKVIKDESGGFYYVGTLDRDLYEIKEVLFVPEDFKGGKYFYRNDAFLLNEDYKEPSNDLIR